MFVLSFMEQGEIPAMSVGMKGVTEENLCLSFYHKLFLLRKDPTDSLPCQQPRTSGP